MASDGPSDSEGSSHYSIGVSDSSENEAPTDSCPPSSAATSGADQTQQDATPSPSSTAIRSEDEADSASNRLPRVVAVFPNGTQRIVLPDNKLLGRCRSSESSCVVSKSLLERMLRATSRRANKLPRDFRITTFEEQEVGQGAALYIPDRKASCRVLSSPGTRIILVVFDGSSTSEIIDVTQTRFVLLGPERSCVSELTADLNLAVQEHTKLLKQTGQSPSDFWSDYCTSRSRTRNSRFWLVSATESGAYRFLLADGTTFVISKGELELLIQASKAFDPRLNEGVGQKLHPQFGDVLRVLSDTWQSCVVLHVIPGKAKPGDGWRGQSTPMQGVIVQFDDGRIVDIFDGRYRMWENVGYLKDPLVMTEHLHRIRESCRALQKQIRAKKRTRKQAICDAKQDRGHANQDRGHAKQDRGHAKQDQGDSARAAGSGDVRAASSANAGPLSDPHENCESDDSDSSVGFWEMIRRAEKASSNKEPARKKPRVP